MQKKWLTALADTFEGGVSTERAMLDIERGVVMNLFHECWGIYGTAKAKNTAGLSFVKTGMVAFDRVKFLPWSDYKAISQGKDVVRPHVGNVDTFQWPINQKWVNSLQFNDIDLARLKNDTMYRANMVGSMANTLGASFDCELFELLIATASAQRGGIVEYKEPNDVDALKNISLWTNFCNLINQMEKKKNAYYMGVPRSEILAVVSLEFYQTILTILGASIHIQSQLDWFQTARIRPEKFGGVQITRHIALNSFNPKSITNNIKHGDNYGYDFKGIQAVIYHRALPWLVQSFKSVNGVVDKDTGNYRMIYRVLWDKGLVYHDLVHVIKDISTEANPLPIEKNLINFRDKYNPMFRQYVEKAEGVESENETIKHEIITEYNLEIPGTIKELRAKYNKEILQVGKPAFKNSYLSNSPKIKTD